MNLEDPSPVKCLKSGSTFVSATAESPHSAV